MANPKVSIVIRAYNEEEHITKLLHGISVQTLQDYEIILVDSGSTDSTAALVKDYGGKVCFISPEEFTFGRVLNLGIENSRGKYCVIASGHVYPTRKDWLEKMIKPFEGNDKIALVYGKQRGCKKSKFSEHQIFSQWFPDSYRGIQDHPFCNNANAAIRKDIWKNIKYDETLTGLEDLDWAKKAIKNGYKIYYSPKAEVIHVHEESFEQIKRRYEREAKALKNIKPDMKFKLTDFIKLFIKNSVHDLKIAKSKNSFLKKFIEILRFRFNQFYGTYKGHKSKIELTERLRKRYYYPNNKLNSKKRKDKTKKNDNKIQYDK